MKREEEVKGGEGPTLKQEKLVEKLKKGLHVVGQRAGQTTPILPFFFRLPHQLSAHNNGSQDCILKSEEGGISLNSDTVSARKLAATLWELDNYKLPLSKMYQGVSGDPTSKLRRHHNHHHHHHHHHQQQLIVKDKGLDLLDPSPSSPDLASAGSLRRQVAATLMQHHRSIRRNHHAIQPVSPASHSSSMEVTPYNPVVTPTSSATFRGGIGESSYSLKTSAELLKVLNRIWNLEEQHASNVTLVRAMKKELDQARALIRELVRDKQADRHEIDELMNQIVDGKLAQKSKEQDQASVAVQSVRNELEDERKLRKRSETLHRKLARELNEVKVTLANAYKDLERERKSRKMLEELCDEFAWKIKNNEHEIHALKPKSEKDWSTRGDHDALILHLCESWIDERMQMKQEPEFGLAEKHSVVEKLSFEIQKFFEAKQNNVSGARPRGTARRRNSLESIPLNLAASAPQDQGGDDSSSEGSDSQCFELDRPITVDLKPQGDEGELNQDDAIMKQNHAKKNLTSQDRSKARNPSRLQVRFEEQMARAISDNEKNQTGDVEEGKAKEENEIIEERRGGCFEGKGKAKEAGNLSSSYIDSILRGHFLVSESGTTTLKTDYGDSHSNSMWRSHPSPVQQWTTKLPTQDHDISESSSKLPPDIKENTLKAKLLEARIRGQSQRSRPRLKSSKVPF